MKITVIDKLILEILLQILKNQYVLLNNPQDNRRDFKTLENTQDLINKIKEKLND